MATFNVSNASQLANAINSAKGGDVIRLAGGNYGRLELGKKFSGTVTITSASDTDKAKFTAVTMTGAANVTLDSLKFEGTGRGQGLKVSQSSNVNVSDSDFLDLQYGATFSRVTGLTVENNSFTSLWHDAMRFAGITNATIAKNVYVEKGSEPGYTHKDFIQFWAVTEGASKNIKISGNEFYSKDGLTHGIFINTDFKENGFHENIIIEDNHFRTSHTHAITVGHGKGVVIHNNVLIKEGAGGAYPVINVTPDSTNVKITSNTVPSVPDLGNSSWVVANNKETAGVVYHWTGGLRGIKVVNQGPFTGANLDLDTGAGGSTPPVGGGDEFRFSANQLDTGTKTSTVQGLDFDDGDVLVLINYREGTVRDFDGVWNSRDGTYAKIDSVADLAEIDRASPAITVKADVAADVLTLKIDQGALIHKVVLHGLADDFLAL